ncbi:hypothetical protein [Hymenobacter sp. DG25B]|uniref:hypothetical protein n=1 Tax=Hymenobacter sp. DG25B TaxID=1385664 RepID=UPI0012E050D6|nr:hypothetical protein [Hymenobacter sp. DG25B]
MPALFAALFFPRCRQLVLLLLSTLWATLSLATPAQATAGGKVPYVLRPATSHAGATPAQQLATTLRLYQEALAPATPDVPHGLGPAWLSHSAAWQHLAVLATICPARHTTAEGEAILRANCLLSDIAPNAP